MRPVSILNKKDAFTLIELVIIIAVLAVLAVIAFPKASGFIGSAKNSTDMHGSGG